MALERDGADRYEARFYQEARAAGGLNHPNIVTVYDVGKSGEVVFMAMEYIEGPELRTLIVEGRPMPVSRAMSIAAQVADGLAYAHQHGVVHRDIKPANIMVPVDGPVKITDFGIARMRVAEVRTQTGIVLGSPRYMSPEQVAGKRADPRADVFSLGVILYEMLTGKPPFTGDDVSSIMFQIMNLVPPPPSSVNAAVPAVLDFIVAKALAKSPEDRYQNAAELARDLHNSAKVESTTPESTATRTLPQLQLDTEAALALARSLPGERRADAVSDTIDTAPTLGLSRAFDSLEATAKLAARIGVPDAVQHVPGTGSATEARAMVSEMRNGPGWSRKDKTIFAASVAGATLVGALIVFI
jgi:serine/threonine protein kinase